MTVTPWRPPTFTGQPRTVRLSAMRADTLECLCRGMTNRGIGDALLITEDTVKSHIRHVLRTLGAHDRLHAAVLVLTGQVRVEVGDAHERRAA